MGKRVGLALTNVHSSLTALGSGHVQSEMTIAANLQAAELIMPLEEMLGLLPHCTFCHGTSSVASRRCCAPCDSSASHSGVHQSPPHSFPARVLLPAAMPNSQGAWGCTSGGAWHVRARLPGQSHTGSRLKTEMKYPFMLEVVVALNILEEFWTCQWKEVA